MKFCPVCGHENSDNSKRCENPDCGYAFFTRSDKQKTKFRDDTDPAFSSGSLISDRYEIVKELGRGGMGVVYLVKDVKLRGRQMALKMIHPELITNEEARQRFIDEVLLCLDLHHPNIVIVYPIEETDRELFFTMEYIPGKSLRQLMDERQGQVPPFTLEEACIIITQILDALEYAHQTTIHRDIKPANVLIQGEFPDIQVKVLDFGIAKVLSASRFTRTAQSMGTAYYMSPEQMRDSKKIDLRSDLYSVGMVFYELLTGMIAAGRFKLPCEMVKGLPVDVDEIIETILSPIPQERYKSASLLKQNLLSLADVAGKTASKDKKNLSAAPIQPWTEPNIGMEFVWISKGCYQMGDTFGDGYSDEQPVHEVCLDGFWMGKYQVNQEEYRKVTGKNPSKFKGDRRPVESVSWEDAKSFISLLNQQTGHIFSLPTEAQWEYAAREGGKRVRFGTGKDTIGPDEANFKASRKYKKSYSRIGEYREKTIKVGRFSSNSLELYDMSGNIWEWCEDVFVEDAYKRHSKNNPVITSGGWGRVLRGGSWFSNPWHLRAAGRRWDRPSIRISDFGFRLVLVSRGQ